MDAGVSGTPSPVGGTPTRIVTSPDGTRIAVFTSGDGPPIVLVHGAAADHTTFRVIGPRLAERYTVHAIDRRGRGGSGDTLPYAIEREYADIAAVVGAIGDHAPAGVPVIGHSYGGRCALGAARLTHAVAAVVCYEGAPTPPGVEYGDAALADELAALDDAGRSAELLETFLRRVVGMEDAALAAYRADPVWPLRVAAAHTIPRELRAEGRSGAAGLEALASVRQPVLQVLGGDSKHEFADATAALDDRLPNGTIVVIPGARHAAHHTHPDALIEAIETFLAGARTDPNDRPMGYSDRA
jgi:pimeloyl-ACP methyl ester carboxylesterase